MRACIHHRVPSWSPFLKQCFSATGFRQLLLYRHRRPNAFHVGVCLSVLDIYISFLPFLSESAFFSVYTCTSSMEMILSTIVIIETNLYFYGEEEVDGV